MKRREFITLLCGAAVGWPLAAQAQHAKQVRRIGVLMNKASNDPLAQSEISAFVGALQERGWVLGGNLQIDYRWGAAETDRYRSYSVELVAHSPDLLLAAGGTAVGALQRVTREVPIVFVETTDPVDRGLVSNLSQPGGNTTGFLQFEFGISAKWLELLKEIAPRVRHIAIIRDPTRFSGVGELAALRTIAPSFNVDVSPVDARDAGTIENAIKDFARRSNGGVIVTPGAASIQFRELITTLATQQQLPAVYAYRYYVMGGGLISYGSNEADQWRRAADYVDRIFKGEKPGDLPVQAPTKYELVINLKAAKALGITVPPSLLVRADEVIE
jgi:putative ABC transport system substrate-binding protein